MRKQMILNEMHNVRMMLLENRIEFLKKNYLGRLAPLAQKWVRSAPAVIRAGIAVPAPETQKEMKREDVADLYAEGVFNYVLAADPDTTKKNSQWLLNMLLKDKIKLEDLEATGADLAAFMQVRNALPVEQRDINRYRTRGELAAALQSLEGKDVSSNNEKDRELEKQMFKQAKVVFDDADYRILIPKTEAASCYFGVNTQWCTAATKSYNHFDDYNEKGPLYIVLEKRTNTRWQFHFETREYTDAMNDLINVNKFLAAHPKVAQFFEKYGLDFGLRVLYQREGLSRNFMREVERVLSDNGIETHDFAVGPQRRGRQATIIVADFTIDGLDSDELRAAETLLKRQNFNAAIEPKVLAAVLDRLEDADLAAIAEWLGMPSLGGQVAGRRDAVITSLATQMSGKGGKELIQATVRNLSEFGDVVFTDEDIHEYMKAVIENGFEYAPYVGDIVFTEDDFLEATHFVTVTVDEIIELVEEIAIDIEDRGFDGSGISDFQVGNNGWIYPREDDYWKKQMDDDVWTRVDPTIRKVIDSKFEDSALELSLDDPGDQRRFGEALIDAMRGTRREPRPDKDQMGDLFDHEIRRMKALAGLLRG
jgi:hypothetical protein